jgi:hypothetical protein
VRGVGEEPLHRLGGESRLAQGLLERVEHLVQGRPDDAELGRRVARTDASTDVARGDAAREAREVGQRPQRQPERPHQSEGRDDQGHDRADHLGEQQP